MGKRTESYKEFLERVPVLTEEVVTGKESYEEFLERVPVIEERNVNIPKDILFSISEGGQRTQAALGRLLGVDVAERTGKSKHYPQSLLGDVGVKVGEYLSPAAPGAVVAKVLTGPMKLRSLSNIAKKYVPSPLKKLLKRSNKEISKDKKIAKELLEERNIEEAIRTDYKTLKEQMFEKHDILSRKDFTIKKLNDPEFIKKVGDSFKNLINKFVINENEKLAKSVEKIKDIKIDTNDLLNKITPQLDEMGLLSERAIKDQSRPLLGKSLTELKEAGYPRAGKGKDLYRRPQKRKDLTADDVDPVFGTRKKVQQHYFGETRPSHKFLEEPLQPTRVSKLSGGPLKREFLDMIRILQKRKDITAKELHRRIRRIDQQINYNKPLPQDDGLRVIRRVYRNKLGELSPEFDGIAKRIHDRLESMGPTEKGLKKLGGGEKFALKNLTDEEVSLIRKILTENPNPLSKKALVDHDVIDAWQSWNKFFGTNTDYTTLLPSKGVTSQVVKQTAGAIVDPIKKRLAKRGLRLKSEGKTALTPKVFKKGGRILRRIGEREGLRMAGSE
tara:strand:+ start:1149 stop:2822 length:1674 start_codon:yes stop_codon:yes gene_type:complete